MLEVRSGEEEEEEEEDNGIMSGSRRARVVKS